MRNLTEPLGRGLAVVLAVVPTVLVAEVASPVHDQVIESIVLCGIWWVGLNAGYAATRTTLAALGVRVAVLRGVLLGLVLTAAVAYCFPQLGIGVGTTFVLAAAILALAGAWETVATRVRTQRKILLVGPGETCLDLIRELRTTGGRRFALVGIVDDNAGPRAFGTLVLGSTSDLPRILATTRPDLVALAPGCDRLAVFTQLLDSAASGFKVLELAQLYEHAFGCVPVRDLTQAWFMSVLHLYQRTYSTLAKRSTDIAGAAVLLVLAAPLFPLLALAVRGTGRRVLLRQQRVGEYGETFTMYKFRTMRPDAERPGEAVWATEDDPRITAAGRVMRRLRLDELPQIWNVFRGEMSLVGPRPERPEFIGELLGSVPWWDRRHLVKPGITGWAQVNRGYTADTEGSLDKLSFDLWYIRHRSLTVDLVICARTIGSILFGDRRAEPSGERLDPVRTLLRYPAPAPRLGPEQVS